MDKTADTHVPLHPLLAERWSPRAFTDRALTTGELGALLEAARWAPSAFNAQPWRFLVAKREDTAEFERLANCLVEGNHWARSAALLVLGVARESFEHNGKPNRWAWHDVGLAVASLMVQAKALGLATHAMAGFDAARARELLGIPEGYEPAVMIAVGEEGNPDLLPAPLAERERAPRSRKPLGEIAFGAEWGRAAPMGPAAG